jgi:hypothetical protein
MPRYIIEVHCEKFDVAVHKESKTVWTASAVFMGKSISVKGRSENSALSAWKEAAEARFYAS